GSGLRAVQPAAQRTVSDLPEPRELSRSAVPGSRAAVANRTPALLGRRQRVFRDAAHALALDAAERRPGRPGRLARASDAGRRCGPARRPRAAAVPGRGAVD